MPLAPLSARLTAIALYQVNQVLESEWDMLTRSEQYRIAQRLRARFQGDRNQLSETELRYLPSELRVRNIKEELPEERLENKTLNGPSIDPIAIANQFLSKVFGDRYTPTLDWVNPGQLLFRERSFSVRLEQSVSRSSSKKKRWPKDGTEPPDGDIVGIIFALGAEVDSFGFNGKNYIHAKDIVLGLGDLIDWQEQRKALVNGDRLLQKLLAIADAETLALATEIQPRQAGLSLDIRELRFDPDQANQILCFIRNLKENSGVK